MENYFFTNLAIFIMLLTALFPISFFFFFNYTFRIKDRKRPKVNLESLDEIDDK
jgi:hypothetical protein